MRLGARTDVGPPPRFITSEPRLGFGAWAVGGRSWGAAGDAAEHEATVRRALERGITFFDTAPTYGDGESERLLGRALRADRERVAIATKVGPLDDPRASLEGSLRRLASDYVDLVQPHDARPLAAGSDTTLPGLALGWLLSRPGVTVVLAGARSREQVDQNLAAPRRLAPATVAAIDAIVADVFRPAAATEQVRRQAATWGERERFIVDKLDGRTAYEAIAAEWTDRGGKPMIAAQVKVFVDQLPDPGLVEAEGRRRWPL